MNCSFYILNIVLHSCELESSSWRGVLDTTLCDKVCQLLAAGWWFSLVSSNNKTDRHDITEILLKVALSTINPPPPKKNKQQQKHTQNVYLLWRRQYLVIFGESRIILLVIAKQHPLRIIYSLTAIFTSHGPVTTMARNAPNPCIYIIPVYIGVGAFYTKIVTNEPWMGISNYVCHPCDSHHHLNHKPTTL